MTLNSSHGKLEILQIAKNNGTLRRSDKGSASDFQASSNFKPLSSSARKKNIPQNIVSTHPDTPLHIELISISLPFPQPAAAGVSGGKIMAAWYLLPLLALDRNDRASSRLFYLQFYFSK